MPITVEEKKKSVEFMNILNDILDIVDNVKELITDDNYLKLCNSLKLLNDNHSNKEVVVQYIERVRERVRTNAIVRNHNSRCNMKVKSRGEMLDDAEKLKRGWVVCNKCDRLVLDIRSHRFTDVCKRIQETKKLTQNSKTLDTSDKTKVIGLIRKVIIEYEGFNPRMNWLKSKI
tara:strand:+ start:48 stop:569 length:522 start_codon:yes stop_codon:yes gene_type:complete